MKKSLITVRVLLAVVAVAGVSLLAPTSAQAAPADFIQKSTGQFSPGGSQPAALCNFRQYGDWVHISATPPAAASGHGWWENDDCKTALADVTVQLQIYKSGSWRNVGSVGKKRVYSGGGSANRAAARVTCVNRNSYKWRSVIDVDLVGVMDANNKLTTGEKTLNCYA